MRRWAAIRHAALILVLVVLDPEEAHLFPQQPLGLRSDPRRLALKRFRPDPNAQFHYRQDRAKMGEFALENKGLKSTISGGCYQTIRKMVVGKD